MAGYVHQSLEAGRRFIGYVVDDMPLSIYVLVFAIAVMVFAVAYWGLTPYGSGLSDGQTLTPLVSFGDALYFSVVTITSLGDGHFRPIGLSRVIVAVEVLFGLAFLGIVVARITSNRLSHHVRRLFSSDAQRRLDEFAVIFEKLDDDVKESMQSLGKAYQPTPAETGIGESEKLQARVIFKNTLNSIRFATNRLHEYFASETKQGGYFLIVPKESMQRLGNSVDKVVMRLTQLVISLSPESRVDILDSSSRQRLSEIVGLQKQICKFVEAPGVDSDVRQCFSQIRQTCDHFPENYFSVPQIVSLEEQPNQLPEQADQPEASE